LEDFSILELDVELVRRLVADMGVVPLAQRRGGHSNRLLQLLFQGCAIRNRALRIIEDRR
jgi:hypothetical protein